MTEPMLSEEEKAIFAEFQLNASPADKVELEFALNDYQDLVANVFRNCRNMGVPPAASIMGYLSAVATCIAAFTADPKPGYEAASAKAAGEALTELLTQHYLGERNGQ